QQSQEETRNAAQALAAGRQEAPRQEQREPGAAATRPQGAPSQQGYQGQQGQAQPQQAQRPAPRQVQFD
ncbi:hypothetical protein QWY29_20965, partial [Nocardioides sp. SOB72]|nr:hypothetical protein [Nocardioides abyssi]